MNWKSTFALVLALGGVAALVYYRQPVAERLGLTPPQIPIGEGKSLATLADLKQSEITQIKITRPESVPVVLKSADTKQKVAKPLELEGGWSVRADAVEELVATLKNLSTRFHLLSKQVAGETEKRFSSDVIQVNIESTGETKQTKLTFYQLTPNVGEDPFTLPVYVQVNDEPEYLRLSPEIASVVGRPVEAYRMREIFDKTTRQRVVETVSLEGTPSAQPIVSDDVKIIEVQTASGGYKLTRIAPNPTAKAPFDRPTNEPVITAIRLAECWKLSNGTIEDRADPVKLQKVLQALPELWIEKFIPNTDPLLPWGAMNGLFETPLSFATQIGINTKLIQELGTQESFESRRSLSTSDPNYQRVIVTLQNGSSRVLQIGATTKVDTKIENAPPSVPGMQPMPKITEIKYHHAKLGTNPLVFELKGDRLAEVLLNASSTPPPSPFPKKDELPPTAKKANPFEELRDRSPVRIDGDFVESVKIERANQTILLKKTKRNPKAETADARRDRWDLLEPSASLAESKQVQDLLTALTRFKSGPGEIVDATTLQALVGGAAVATGVVDVSQRSRFTKVTITHEADCGIASRIVYVSLSESPTGKTILVNEDRKGLAYLVESMDTATVQRNDRAYRALRLFDLSEGNRVVALNVTGAGEYQLQEVPGAKPSYRFGGTINRDADTPLANKLFGDLARAEAVSFVYDPPTEAEVKTNTENAKVVAMLLKQVNPLAGLDLDYRMLVGSYENALSTYGLSKPRAVANVIFGGPKNVPTRKLLIGSEKPGGGEVYAKFEDSKTVFTIKQDLADSITKGALTLLPLQLWEGSSESILKLNVIIPNSTPFTLNQNDGGWKLTAPRELPLTNSAVIPTAGALATLKADRYESLSQDKLADYGLDAPVIKFEMTAEEVSKDANTPKKTVQRTLSFGKPTPDNKGRYALASDTPGVLVLSESIFQSVNKGVYDYLNKRILSVDPSKIQKLTLNSKNGALTLIKEGSDWKAEGNPLTLDKLTLDLLVNTVTNLEVQKIVDFESPEALKKYGLDAEAKPNQITVQLADNKSFVLNIGNELADGSNSRYVSVNGNAGIGVVDIGMLRRVNKTRLDLADRSLLKFDPNDLLTLTRKMGAETFVASNSGTAWEVTQPQKFAGDSITFEELTEQLAILRATSVEEIDAKDLKKFGLDTPLATVELEILLKGKTVKKTLKIGKSVEENAQKGSYAQLEGSTSVVVVAYRVVEQLTAKPLHFRDKNLAKFISADKITLARGELNYTLERPMGKWVITEPAKVDAEDESIRELIDALARLRAETIVADKPADLKPYGLDKPEKWKLFNGDKEVLSLWVGGPEVINKDGKKIEGLRRYAKLEKSDLVVLLDLKLSSQLNAEVRKRALWPTLDVAQANFLSVEIKGGTGSYEFAKSPLGWVDPKDPTKRAHNQSVILFLDTIANLRAERVIQFKSDENTLKLYGLNPPEKIITVKTEKNQTRVLHIGRLDDQKRLYVRTEDPKSSEIVILGVIDSETLNRTRAEFEAAPKKELLPILPKIPEEKK